MLVRLFNVKISFTISIIVPFLDSIGQASYNLTGLKQS